MTSPPEQPFGGREFPRLEDLPSQADPAAPVDYPTNYPLLPPPVYPGYPGYAGYSGYPGYAPYGQIKPPGTNGKAVAALVTALVGFACCGLSSIAGLILGVIAMRECRRTGQEGYGLALAGAIVGGLVTVFWALYLLVIVGLYATGAQ